MRETLQTGVILLFAFVAQSAWSDDLPTTPRSNGSQTRGEGVTGLLFSLQLNSLGKAARGAKLLHSTADDIAGDCSPQVCCCYPNNDETAVCVGADVCYQKNGMVIAPGRSVAPCDLSLCHY
jgi:hypothetical protein